MNRIVCLSSGLSDWLNCINSGSFSLTSPFLFPSCLRTGVGLFIKNLSVFIGIPVGERSPMVITVPKVW